MQLEDKIVNGGEIFVAGNWLPSRKLFKNENFFAAMGLSPAFPKGNWAEGVRFTFLHFVLLRKFLTIVSFAESSLAYIKETEPEMAEPLTSAALKVAWIRAELNAKTMKKPAAPKVFSSEPIFFVH